MSLPFGHAETTFESFLQELPEDYWELAIEFKAFTRSRKIKTPAQLMQVVMGYCGRDAVWRETAGNFTLVEERISDTAIHTRLKACVPWVKALLSRMMGAAAQPLLEGPLRFVMIDGSTVQGPGAKGPWYRRHLAIDMVKLHWVHGVVTDAHEGERLGHYPLPDGDGVGVDRGYNRAQMGIDPADRGGGLGVRYNPQGLPLDEAAGQKIDLEAPLKATVEIERCLPVRVRNATQEYLEGHLHARRLPAAARRRARAAAKQAGRHLRPRTLALAAWVLIFTTVPPAVLPTATVMALYRVRWQVELAIQRLKSILNMDKLRARKDGRLADLSLHGTLLYAWVVEKRARRRCGDDWNRLNHSRRATPWRLWKLLHQELTVAIRRVSQWNLNRWAACLDVMQERPRRRSLQTLPDRVSHLIAYCQANGMSNI